MFAIIIIFILLFEYNANACVSFFLLSQFIQVVTQNKQQLNLEFCRMGGKN